MMVRKNTLMSLVTATAAALIIFATAIPSQATELNSTRQVDTTAISQGGSKPNIDILHVRARNNAGEAAAQRLLYSHCDDTWTYGIPGSTGTGTFAHFPVIYTPLSFTCILETGNNNNGVAALQESLDGCYGKGLVIDGVFGSATYNALLQVQSTIGVTIDGVYGPATRHAMEWWGFDDVCRTGAAYGL